MEGSINKQSLQEFVFRVDVDGEHMYAPLSDFLRLLWGLRLLAILLGDCHGTVFELDEDVLENHGRSLEVLVLESRDHVRKVFSARSSHVGKNELYRVNGPRDSSLSRIIHHGPNLTGLCMRFA